jgi:hypothetical protein
MFVYINAIASPETNEPAPLQPSEWERNWQPNGQAQQTSGAKLDELYLLMDYMEKDIVCISKSLLNISSIKSH